LVVTRQELETLRDRLYVLQCAVQDVEQDLAEATDASDTKQALEWLLQAAKESLA
jgi:Lon protease-like protein